MAQTYHDMGQTKTTTLKRKFSGFINFIDMAKGSDLKFSMRVY